MPSKKCPSMYAKFLKDIVSKKKSFLENELIMVNKEATAVIQRKLPHKLKDSGSLTIPCDIGPFHCDKALCDLGASISLMPLLVAKKLGLRDVKPSSIGLQMVDKSLVFLQGILQDVIVKVDQFYIPIDFVVLEMQEDSRIPIIFGIPFLAIV